MSDRLRLEERIVLRRNRDDRDCIDVAREKASSCVTIIGNRARFYDNNPTPRTDIDLSTSNSLSILLWGISWQFLSISYLGNRPLPLQILLEQKIPERRCLTFAARRTQKKPAIRDSSIFPPPRIDARPRHLPFE